ncbi:sulfotransferase family 2 domain-containing protein [Phaeobacter italicus]|uniref:sulfotransferase family 2 domain-containing protein n=1 Tax=Phaeobacter italicus TaxID=481446 RepID=UPI0013F4E228|nr:sulfotransferase family 2 domain-containing protein [Phaeobacter italicus]
MERPTPITCCNNKIAHFAHVPKCGGVSVEFYAMKTGIQLAFWDSHYVSHPAPQKWNISSPQHIDGPSLARLIPPAFLDFGFAVVRDPISRLKSAFKFQMLVERKIETDRLLSDFVREDLIEAAGTLGKWDNHFLPQSQFLIPKMSYQVFRLEDGLDQVKTFMDAQFLGTVAAEPMSHSNLGPKPTVEVEGQFELDEEAEALAAGVYSEDFRNFQYPLPERVAAAETGLMQTPLNTPEANPAP